MVRNTFDRTVKNFEYFFSYKSVCFSFFVVSNFSKNPTLEDYHYCVYLEYIENRWIDGQQKNVKHLVAVWSGQGISIHVFGNKVLFVIKFKFLNWKAKLRGLTTYKYSLDKWIRSFLWMEAENGP